MEFESGGSVLHERHGGGSNPETTEYFISHRQSIVSGVQATTPCVADIPRSSRSRTGSIHREGLLRAHHAVTRRPQSVHGHPRGFGGRSTPRESAVGRHVPGLP